MCVDQAPTKDCEDWKKVGFCTAHSSMIVHCKKTCEFCSYAGNKDKFSWAIYWVLMKSIFYIYGDCGQQVTKLLPHSVPKWRQFFRRLVKRLSLVSSHTHINTYYVPHIKSRFGDGEA